MLENWLNPYLQTSHLHPSNFHDFSQPQKEGEEEERRSSKKSSSVWKRRKIPSPRGVLSLRHWWPTDRDLHEGIFPQFEAKSEHDKYEEKKIFFTISF